MAKDFFNENNIAFTDHNVLDDITARQEMVQKSGQMGVPVIEIDGQLVVGFDEHAIRGMLGM